MAKVLIIDDSETLRMQLRETLEQAGHEILEGCDGINGLEVLEKNPDCDLILCDLNMPRMDGLTLCKRLQENPAHSKIPVVVLTTEANPSLKQEAKAFGVRGWIIKPFDPEKLLAGISFLLKKQG